MISPPCRPHRWPASQTSLPIHRTASNDAVSSRSHSSGTRYHSRSGVSMLLPIDFDSAISRQDVFRLCPPSPARSSCSIASAGLQDRPVRRARTTPGSVGQDQRGRARHSLRLEAGGCDEGISASTRVHGGSQSSRTMAMRAASDRAIDVPTRRRQGQGTVDVIAAAPMVAASMHRSCAHRTSAEHARGRAFVAASNTGEPWARSKLRSCCAAIPLNSSKHRRGSESFSICPGGTKKAARQRALLHVPRASRPARSEGGSQRAEAPLIASCGRVAGRIAA